MIWPPQVCPLLRQGDASLVETGCGLCPFARDRVNPVPAGKISTVRCTTEIEGQLADLEAVSTVRKAAPIWQQWNLISNFGRRDLKAKFKGTWLGWAWSLLVPLASLGIYTLIFSIVFRMAPPDLGNGRDGIFAVWLFAGLTLWTFFASSINSGIAGLGSSGGMLQKVYFPPYAPVLGAGLAVGVQSIIEIGIVRTPFNSSRFNCRFLSAEPMVAAMTREWDWCPGQDVIPVCDLAGKPLIIYRRFNQLLHDTFEAADVRPDIYCRNDDARTTVLWANAGLGVAIAPAAALNLAAPENLRVKQIDEKKLRTRLVAIWRQDRYLSTAGEKFLAALEMEEKA